jgi:hypothetical protein
VLRFIKIKLVWGYRNWSYNGHRLRVIRLIRVGRDMGYEALGFVFIRVGNYGLVFIRVRNYGLVFIRFRSYGLVFIRVRNYGLVFIRCLNL